MRFPRKHVQNLYKEQIRLVALNRLKTSNSSHYSLGYHVYNCNFTDDVWTKKKFSTFSYKLVQISPIMILVNSGAFLSISSWFCELTELIFVMIPYISSTGYLPKTQGIMGHVQVANMGMGLRFSPELR